MIAVVLNPATNVCYDLMLSVPTRRVRMNEDRHPRISVDAGVCHGQACIRGTRIPVHQVVGMLANGDTVEGLLEDFPSLAREDVMAALAYTAELAEEQISPIEAAG
jgi:uncharacterized protein (DUF433 family)